MATILGHISYIIGHIRYGHYELQIRGSELEKFNSMTQEEQEEYLRDNGELLIDDVEIEDIGDIININVYED